MSGTEDVMTRVDEAQEEEDTVYFTEEERVLIPCRELADALAELQRELDGKRKRKRTETEGEGSDE